MLVLAGAGTGKTRVVTFRIARLIQSGIAADRVLAVTFTNKAAREMQQRIGQLLGKRLEKRPLISTFHSLCVRILRRHAPRLGYPQNFVIYGTGDQDSLARQVLRQVKSASRELKPRDLLYFIGNWKSKSVRPDDAQAIAHDERAALAARAYARYQRELKNAGAVDFDDLLLLTEDLFRLEPDAACDEAARFDHVLVDEYQDTNPSQYRIIKRLARDHRNLCVVGDDDQSIYAWRGAEVQHILNFQHDWKNAEVFCLEENYRSTAVILDAANRLIKHNRTRHIKILRSGRPSGEKPSIRQFDDETREAAETAGDIRRQLTAPGVEPADFAVLFRTGEQSRVFETEFRKLQIPYVLLGGQSFFDRREVKDILAYLRLLESPDDEVALRRVLNVPPRGIGQRARDRLVALADENRCSIWQAANRFPNQFSGRAASGLRQLTSVFRAAVDTLARSNQPRNEFVDVARTIINEVDYRAEIERSYDTEKERDMRWGSVEQLINALAVYAKESKQPTFNEFIDQLTLGDRDVEENKDEKLKRNAVVLMTMHSAKGLEFPFVHLVGFEEGILPHRKSVDMGSEAIEEERRLCYVGVTRAQERLILSLTRSRMKWGKPRPTRPSRFLYEITGQTDHPNYLRLVAETV